MPISGEPVAQRQRVAGNRRRPAPSLDEHSAIEVELLGGHLDFDLSVALSYR
jgi:hypothetical protein